MQETDWTLLCTRVAERLGLTQDDVEAHILAYAETLKHRMQYPTKVELDFFRVGYLRISRFKCDRAVKAYRTRLEWELDYLKKIPESDSLKKTTSTLKSQIEEATKAATIADDAFGIPRRGVGPEKPLLKSIIKKRAYCPKITKKWEEEKDWLKLLQDVITNLKKLPHPPEARGSTTDLR